MFSSVFLPLPFLTFHNTHTITLSLFCSFAFVFLSFTCMYTPLCSLFPPPSLRRANTDALTHSLSPLFVFLFIYLPFSHVHTYTNPRWALMCVFTALFRTENSLTFLATSAQEQELLVCFRAVLFFFSFGLAVLPPLLMVSPPTAGDTSGGRQRGTSSLLL